MQIHLLGDTSLLLVTFRDPLVSRILRCSFRSEPRGSSFQPGRWSATCSSASTCDQEVLAG